MEWKTRYWKAVFDTRCEAAIDKKVAASRISRNEARTKLIKWLETESGLKIEGYKLDVEKHHALVMLMHRRGIAP